MLLDLEEFFQEKEIPPTEWEIECEGNYHTVDTDFVISAILSTTDKERAAIARVLAKMEIHNEDILNYLQHLAKCRLRMMKYVGKF